MYIYCKTLPNHLDTETLKQTKCRYNLDNTPYLSVVVDYLIVRYKIILRRLQAYNWITGAVFQASPFVKITRASRGN